MSHEHLLALSGLLFCIGALGVLLRRNLLVTLLCHQVMLGAAMLALIGFDREWAVRADATNGSTPGDGQVFAFLILAVGAAQLVVGLAIALNLTRHRDSSDIDDFGSLRW
jgi:NADH-quinone oxidoreductase subunit K